MNFEQSKKRELKLNQLSRLKVMEFLKVLVKGQINKDLNIMLTVEKFITFYNDYTDKLQIIHDFIELHVPTYYLIKTYSQNILTEFCILYCIIE